MTSTPAEVLEGMWAAWRRGDKLSTLAFFADDVVVGNSIPRDVLPFGGLTVGKPALSDRLQMVMEQFQTLRYDGRAVGSDGEIARGQVEFLFRHRITRLDLESSFRVLITVRNSLIVSYDIFNDNDKFRAFAALVAAHPAANTGRDGDRAHD